MITGNRPTSFSLNNIILSDIVRGNGTITFKAALNKFIDSSGNESTTGFIPTLIILNGFKTPIIPPILKPTIITPGSYEIPGQNNILTTAYTESMIK